MTKLKENKESARSKTTRKIPCGYCGSTEQNTTNYDEANSFLLVRDEFPKTPKFI